MSISLYHVSIGFEEPSRIPVEYRIGHSYKLFSVSTLYAWNITLRAYLYQEQAPYACRQANQTLS